MRTWGVGEGVGVGVGEGVGVGVRVRGMAISAGSGSVNRPPMFLILGRATLFCCALLRFA